jgi:integrase
VVTLNGRDIYLGRHNTRESRGNYDRVMAEWLANGRRLAAPDDLTIAELIVRYLEQVDARYSSDEPAKIRLALKPVRQFYGTIQVREFGPLALKAIRQKLMESDLVRSQINKRVRRIVQMFRWAASDELIPVTVHQALKTVEGLRRGRGDVREGKPVKPVPDAHVEAIRRFVSRQVWTMIELQRLSGMRPGEVCQMRTCDINTQGRIWEYRPAAHKTAHHGRDRIVFLGPQAQAVLKPWLRAELGAYLFQPREAEAERREHQRSQRKSKVQPSQVCRKKKHPRKRAGESYDTSSYGRAIVYAIDKANQMRAETEQAPIPSWHPHQLRHSTATKLRREFGLDAVRAVLGHSTPVVTEVYAELDQAKAAEVMARIG